MEYAKQENTNSIVLSGTNGERREGHRKSIYENNKGIFLTHLIYPSKKAGQCFDIYIYLIRHKLDNFSDVEKAEFFFGHMWGNKVFTKKPKNGIIGISTSAYAPFLCTCCVKFKNGEEIQIERYIDFEFSKVYEKLQ